ncbi:DUF7563 family protein [Halorubrum saccharovorum]
MNRQNSGSDDAGRCLNCGTHVSETFQAVFGDEDDRAHRLRTAHAHRVRTRCRRRPAAGLGRDGIMDPPTIRVPPTAMPVYS